MNPLKHLLVAERLRVSDLEGLYLRFGSAPHFFEDIISALEWLEPEQAWRIFWLLRRLAKARKFSENEIVALVATTDFAGHWIARLTLCQLFAGVEIFPTVREEVFPVLRECFADRRQIIRAWAISALATFRHDVRFQSEIAVMLGRARREPGKAMQARLRQLKLSDGKAKRAPKPESSI